MANAGARLKFKEGELFSRVNYLSAQPLDFPNTKSVGPRALVDVGGTYRWQGHYFFTLEMKNIDNVQTFDAVGYPLPRLGVYMSVGYGG